MNKKTIIIICTIAFMISIYIGSMLYNKISTKDENSQEELENKNTELVSEIKEFDYLAEEANAVDTKISPNAVIILKKYYKGCGHAVSDYAIIPEEMVNKTANEIQEEYKEWDIEEFTEKEIMLSKYVEGYCNEHYILKDENGKVMVYEIDENGKETLKQETEIETNYLPETDKENLKNGIKVYTKENLNILLQDFE